MNVIFRVIKGHRSIKKTSNQPFQNSFVTKIATNEENESTLDKIEEAQA